MSQPKNESELLETMRRELYTPVVGDILDSHGYFHCFLPQEVRPMLPEMKLAGFAMPVLMMDVYGEQQEPFGLMTHALDDLARDEIYIASGSLPRSATWGEIMTAAAKSRGAAGAVLDGFHRDTPKVLEQRFPVFSRGPYGQDSAPRMKVADFRCRIEIAGISIAPGDIVFGDVDGALVIPQAVAREVIEAALEKARSEKRVRAEIENGMAVTDAFRKYGVL